MEQNQPAQANQADADDGYEKWRQRVLEYEATWSAAYGFTDVVDHATLIYRFKRAIQDRYSEWNHDPILKPIIERSKERYAELRIHDFTYANRVAETEAIRAILALDLSQLQTSEATNPHG